MPYEILLQHVSIIPCLYVFGISHFGLYYLYSSTNYITIDLKRKKRIFLKDIVDKKTIIKKMREGTDVYAKERAVLEENENEKATLNLRES